jgi:hypothetical protein
MGSFYHDQENGQCLITFPEERRKTIGHRSALLKTERADKPGHDAHLIGPPGGSDCFGLVDL